MMYHAGGGKCRIVLLACVFPLHSTHFLYFTATHICYYVFIDSLQSVLNLDVPGQATTLKLVLIHQLVAVI